MDTVGAQHQIAPETLAARQHHLAQLGVHGRHPRREAQGARRARARLCERFLAQGRVQARAVHHDATVRPLLGLLSVADVDGLGGEGRPDVAAGVLGAAHGRILLKVDAEPLQRPVAVGGDAEAGAHLAAEARGFEQSDMVPGLPESQCCRLFACW